MVRIEWNPCAEDPNMRHRSDCLEDFSFESWERDAHTIEKSSHSWPRRKAPRPKNTIKTRASVGPRVFEVFHIARAEV